ncbi:MAG: hypothetical protein ACXWUG_19840 [Polyangiales bacterium]
MRRALATVAPFVFVACSYPEFGFRSGDAAATDEGLVDTSEADSAIDSLFVDTSTSDSGSDDGTVADADALDTAAPRGCALPHDFCQDFDSVTAPTEGGWTGNFSDGTGAFALDDTTSTSSPKSLRVTVPLGSVTESAMLERNITITSSTTVIRIEADIMVPSLSWPGADSLIMFKLQRSSAGDGVSLVAAGGKLEIAAQTDASWVSWPLTGIVAGKWFHVRIEASLHPTAGVVRAWIDDMTTPQVDKTGVVTANADDLPRRLLVGLFAWKSSSPFRANYDDVSYDVP